MADKFPQYNIQRGFRSTAPDIFEQGLSADILLAEYFDEDTGPPPPPPTFLKEIPIAAGQVTGTHTNMPLLMQPSLMTGWGALTLAEAQSLRLYADSDLIVEIPREVVSSDEIHCKRGTVDSAAMYYADYDGIRADYAATDTYGRNAVWSDYAAVYHLDALTDDYSGNTQTLTNNNSVVTTTGKVGTAADFGTANTNKSLTRTASSVLVYADWRDSDGFSMTAWWNLHNKSNATNMIFWMRSSNGSLINQGGIQWNTTNNLVAAPFPNNSGGQTLLNPSFNPSTATWYKSTLRWTPSNTSLVNNGSQVATASHVWGTFSNSVNSFGIGRLGTLGGDYINGLVDEVRIRKSFTSDDWEITEYNNQNNNGAFWGTVVDAGAPPASITLTANTATYTLTTVTAGLVRSYTLNATTTTFAVTTVPAVIRKGFVLTATRTTFTVTTNTAIINRQYFINAVRATYNLTGTATGVLRGRRINATTTTFTLTTILVQVRADRVLTANTRSYTLTTLPVLLSYGRRLEAQTASYSISTFPATLTRSYRINAVTRAFVASGVVATFSRTFNIFASPTAFTLTTSPAAVLYGRMLDAELAEYTLAFFQVVLDLTNFILILASTQQYTLTTTPATATRTYVLNTVTAIFTTTASQAELTVARTLRATATTYSLTTPHAQLQRGYRFNAATTAFVITPQMITTNRTYAINATVANVQFTGRVASITVARRLPTAPISYNLTTTAVTFSRDYSIRTELTIYNVTQIPVVLQRTYIIELSDGQYVLVGLPAELQYTGNSYPFYPQDTPFVKEPSPFTADTSPFVKQTAPFSASDSPFRTFARRPRE